jgi:flavin-dependent dehydrogenase
MASPDLEVAIAGAGPAGVATAVALVRRDPSLRGRIALFDRARFPRQKPCGGGLTGHAEEAMAALGLALTVPHLPAPRARVTFGAVDRAVTLARPVRVIRREELDASLVAQARDVGIDVREGAPVEGARVEGDRVSFGAGGRALSARILVGADGAGSAVRKLLRGERRADAPDAERARPIRLFRAELPAPRHAALADDTMLYDFTAMSEGLRGYVWIFPVPGGRINVGLMHAPTRALSGAELTAMLGRHLRRFGVSLDDGAAAGALRGWPAWGYEPGAPVSAPHLLVVGDAAGIDALTGEGIAVGMEQAAVAAEAITDALARGDFRLRGYRRALRRATVGRELAIDRWLARLLYGEGELIGDGWRRWLPLVLWDERMLELYAARVCGSLVLADRKRSLVAALLRHLAAGGGRARRLAAAEGELPKLLAA